MSHETLVLRDLELGFPHKICFSQFSTSIYPGQRIGILGRNGSGKSSLLKLIQETQGSNAVFGYVPQIIDDREALSGGQRFQQALSDELSKHPDILCLDEPTNHLDTKNRRSLMRMLKQFYGTLLVVSHDVELLRSCVDTLWHIDEGCIHVFSGSYDDYMRELSIKRASIEQELAQLERAKKDMHESLMKEQHRAKKSKLKGEKSIENRKWPTITSTAKMTRAQECSGRKKQDIREKRQDLTERLSELRLPEIIKPKFSIQADAVGSRMLVSIGEGTVGYDEPILSNIGFSISSGERIAITGDNGSGKSTLVKAILSDPAVIRSGSWYTPKRKDIGYLDQHYGTLNSSQTVLGSIQVLVPTWTHAELRKHLNDFLFRKNEEVNALVSTLSGGEKARLSLAQIAAKTPKLLILDEVTNNLDLETREHVIQALREYPGALIVISHDGDFIQKLSSGSRQFRTCLMTCGAT